MRLIPWGSTTALFRIAMLTCCFLPAGALLWGFTLIRPADAPDTPEFDPACRGAVNITINPTQCVSHPSVSSLLVGDFTAEEYSLEIVDQAGNSLGEIIPGTYAGQTLTAEITHDLSNFSCSTSITVYDMHPPLLTIPDDIELLCTQSPTPATTGTATAFDCSSAEVTYEDTWSETFCGNPKVEIHRIWTATDAQGLTTIDTQYIAIRRATAADIRFPPDRDYTCTQYLDDPQLTEPRQEKAGIPTLVNIARCGLVYTYQDQRVDLCGNPETSFIILRKWTVLDACGNQVFTQDGAGNDNIQLIRVMDKTAPVIQPVLQDIRATIRKEDNGLALCSSVDFIPPPNIIDECNSVSIRIFSAVGELEYLNGVDGAAGGYIPFPGLTLGGPHQIYYEAVDACGNSSNISAFVNVIDDETPIMLCDQQITVSLSLGGRGQLEPFMIDHGVRDNCCLEKMQIKWVDEPVISFRDRIEIYCMAQPREAVLRAWDCRGNFNDCVSTVVIHDPLAAGILSAPQEVVEVDCNSPRDIYSNPQHDAPVFQDNCPLDVRFSIRDSINACGTADLWREWTAQDHPDHPVLRVGQLVRFKDAEAPVLSAEARDPVCDQDGDCQEWVRFNFSVTDNCTEILNVSYRFSKDGDPFKDDVFGQLIQGPDGFAIEGVYPIGEHEVYITATDACGNATNGRYAFQVQDCSAPDLVCRQNAVFIIGEDQQIVLSPEDLVETAGDDCNNFSLAFANTAAELLLYDCDSLGLRQLSIWATDARANRSSCTVTFTIDQEDLSCAPFGRLSGYITTEAGKGVALVQMMLTGADTLHTVTDKEGYYRFENVPLDVELELHSVKEINPGNGLSVLDILRISRHILGLDLLTNPYHQLAADVNRSGSISLLDVLAARRLILGLAETFPNNDHSWRCIPAAYQFEDPGNPLQERVPETTVFTLVEKDTQLDFIGIKYGDVNGSADPGR